MDYLLKCRALYIWSISLTLEINLVIDNEFCQLENSFFVNYYKDYPDLFSLIYEESEEGNKEEKYYKLLKYLYEFTVNDSAIKLYDDIGMENVNKISELAYKFCEYYYVLYDMNNNVRIRS